MVLSVPTIVLISVCSFVGFLMLLAWYAPTLMEARGKKKKARVVPEGAERLSAEDLEAVCARTGFSPDEALRLHEQFSKIGGGARRVESSEFLEGLPELAGPLLPRLPAALRLQGSNSQGPKKGRGLDFRTAASAVGVFCERAPSDDKTRLLFRLYDADGDGQISRADLRSLLELIVPMEEDDGAKAQDEHQDASLEASASSLASAASDDAAPDVEAGGGRSGGEAATASEERLGLVESPAQTPAEERARLIDRAVDAVFEELGGRASKDMLGLEQFAMIAGDLAAERCSVFF
mmetsp:Transcript_30397/g.87061  ORF Transcript_30397/g.87061 Transcript_30397/m.87061 type:complete len:293 (-) Transcript_30397:57-935(-)